MGNWIAKNLKMLIFCFAVVVLLPSVRANSNEPAMLPPFKKMLSWGPQPDRTMVVSYPGISYRYEILAWGPASGCDAVVEVDETNELRWLTSTGWFAHEYFTKKDPVAYKNDYEVEWTWLLKKTSEQFEGK